MYTHYTIKWRNSQIRMFDARPLCRITPSMMFFFFLGGELFIVTDGPGDRFPSKGSE